MSLYVIGIGPGNMDLLTPQALKAIQQCTLIVGYANYIQRIASLLTGKEIISTGMKGEKIRCLKALESAQSGKDVAIVSSGDAGVYGMASLIYELSPEYPAVSIQVIPGITAACSAAAVLGAPLAHDFAIISLSDLLTPWPVIEKRLIAAANADFIICLYNPDSKTRTGYLAKACAIIQPYKADGTLCGYVQNISQEDIEFSRICTLGELKEAAVDMSTTIIIGNTQTKIIGNKLITPRGYL